MEEEEQVDSDWLQESDLALIQEAPSATQGPPNSMACPVNHLLRYTCKKGLTNKVQRTSFFRPNAKPDDFNSELVKEPCI